MTRRRSWTPRWRLPPPRHRRLCLPPIEDRAWRGGAAEPARHDRRASELAAAPAPSDAAALLDEPRTAAARDGAGGAAAATMSAPRATMRLQLHRDFTFADAAQLVPYIARSGHQPSLCSPILTARAGSMHGYDVTDPTRVNPELGGEAGLRNWSRPACRRNGPDRRYRAEPHGRGRAGKSLVGRRAAARPRQPLCQRSSTSTGTPTVYGKVLAPFLGEPYGEALRDGAITLDARPAAAR